MKKLLGIVVLGLFLSSNVHANIKYIKCVSYELISFKRSGEVIKEKADDIEDLFEIDNKNKMISIYMELGNYFSKINNIEWSNSSIKWEGSIGDDNLKVANNMNRITGEYITDSEMKEIVNPVFKRQIVKFNCNIIDKKF